MNLSHVKPFAWEKSAVRAATRIWEADAPVQRLQDVRSLKPEALRSLRIGLKRP